MEDLKKKYEAWLKRAEIEGVDDVNRNKVIS